MEMVDLDSFLPSTHPYRRFQAYLPETTEALADVSHLKGADGYGVERLFRCLLLQLSEPTPDYTLFTRVRTPYGQKTHAASL
jgi:hypothetical protein